MKILKLSVVILGLQLLFPSATIWASDGVTAETIIKRLDANMTANTVVMKAKMVVNSSRNEREMEINGYLKNGSGSFVEYLSPEREKGTKMLKINDMIWIYSPSTDRTTQISGHMLRQSVMGSDLSYEDLMERDKLNDTYNSELIGEELQDGRLCWVLLLTAKADNVAYKTRKIWIDKEHYVPLAEELYAKSGQLLKKTILGNLKKIGTRWYPMKMNYRDMLKNGKGTDFIVLSIEFDVAISAAKFTKAVLTK